MDDKKVWRKRLRRMETTKWKLYCKGEKGDELNGDCYNEKSPPGHLGSFISSNSKRTVNNLIRETNGFFFK